VSVMFGGKKQPKKKQPQRPLTRKEQKQLKKEKSRQEFERDLDGIIEMDMLEEEEDW
jgi:hypothetical protein